MTRLEFITKYVFEPTPEQKAFISSEFGFNKFGRWNRQSGKTKVGLANLLYTAMTNSDVNVIYIGKSYSKVISARETMTDMLPNWITDFHVAATNKNEITLKNGSRLIFASGDLIRGLSAKEIFVDDWREIDDFDELKRSLFPIVASTGIVYGLTT